MADNHESGKRNFLSQHPSITISIEAELRRIRAGATWISGDRLVESLVKGDGINVALVMLKKGAQMEEHRTKAPITVQVIEGEIVFIEAGARHVLAPGSLFALEREIPHAVEAVSDAAFILTIGGEPH